MPWYLRRARHPFKDKVVGRYWSWFAMRPWQISYDRTLRFNANLRDYMQQKIFFEGYYERALVAYLQETLRPDDVFWDVGANVGAISMVAAKLCQQVYAFEPEPAARRQLQEHVTLNELKNIRIVPVALSDNDGEAQLDLGPAGNTGMHSLCRRGAGPGTVVVPTRRADTLLSHDGFPVPTVMKVDVEGAEWLVFQGSQELLSNRRLRCVIFEAEHDGQGSVKDRRLGDCLGKQRFDLSELGTSDPENADQSLTNFLALRTIA